MLKARTLLVAAAALGLAACESGTTSSAQGMYPLLDSTGTVVGYASPSAAQHAPPGTALRMNINGRDQLVTIGPRTSQAVSAGTPVIIGMDNGRPIIGHVGPGTGNLAPVGTPVVTGTQGDSNRPTIVYQQAGDPRPLPGDRR